MNTVMVARRILLICTCLLTFGCLNPSVFSQDDLPFSREKYNELAQSELVVGLRKAANELQNGKHQYCYVRCRSLLEKYPYSVVAADLFCASSVHLEGDEWAPAMKASVRAQELSGLLSPLAIEPAFVVPQKAVIEVEQLLCEYPGLLGSGSKREFLKRWLERRVGGSFCNRPIRVEFDPTLEVSAAHRNLDTHAVIQLNPVHSKHPAEFANEELCSWLLYEVFNTEHFEGSRSLVKRAFDLEITEDEYVMRIARYEHLSWLRLRRFYIEHIFPLSDKKPHTQSKFIWNTQYPSRFAENMKRFDNNLKYPWHYGKYYKNLYQLGWWLSGVEPP